MKKEKVLNTRTYFDILPITICSEDCVVTFEAAYNPIKFEVKKFKLIKDIKGFKSTSYVKLFQKVRNNQELDDIVEKIFTKECEISIN